ncbi:MAG TPA: 3-dehydroquinate synthase [Bacteroidetes bacterium]|nr:3-dehydroquinate synthase [Bacteroidota bacterium]
MHNESVLLRLKSVPHRVGKGALAASAALFSGYDKMFVLVDENTEKYCLPFFRQLLPEVAPAGIVRIKSGEVHKNIHTTISIWEQLTRLHAGRDALLINLGGGVITDIGGFAATTYKRGIDFINIPTTLLGQVDAAIGSKTGIDFQEYKNHVGLFADPKGVIADPLFLDTLPDRFLRSGFAEMIKYALIMDTPLWDRMNGKPFDALHSLLDSLMVMSVQDKITVVEKDKHESGWRKILNFGHTVGHALETFLMKTDHPATHGEAVAAGMICATRISEEWAGFPRAGSRDIYRMIDRNFRRLLFSEKDIPALLLLMRQDKKNKGGKLHFTLLKRPGEAVPDIKVPEESVEESLRFYLRNQ